jgi:hypothetical protein
MPDKKEKPPLARVAFSFLIHPVLFSGDYFVFRVRFQVLFSLLPGCKLHTARGAFD